MLGVQISSSPPTLFQKTLTEKLALARALCFKKWLDYKNIHVNDGTGLDAQSVPVFDIKKFSENGGFNYVPLHGSLDFITIERLKGDGLYKGIQKISPITYYADRPENI